MFCKTLFFTFAVISCTDAAVEQFPNTIFHPNVGADNSGFILADVENTLPEYDDGSEHLMALDNIYYKPPSFVDHANSTTSQIEIDTEDLFSNSNHRIVGGEETEIIYHPYQVSFIVNQSYFCGGFIISENYIMTAAHCAQDVDPSTVVLRAGSTYRRNGTIIPIAEVIPHPDYDNPAFDNDIAVMRTVEPIQFTEVIQPIPLAPKGRPMYGRTDVIVSGWGRTKQGASSIPERLMNVTVPVVYFTQCRLVYPDVLTDHMFCAGNFFLGGKGTCQGDSGGAAVQEGVAVGIVSFGRGCGQPLSPSVFANIAELRDWVTQQTDL